MHNKGPKWAVNIGLVERPGNTEANQPIRFKIQVGNTPYYDQYRAK